MASTYNRSTSSRGHTIIIERLPERFPFVERRWEWTIKEGYSPASRVRGNRGRAYSKRRAIKKALKRIPIQVKVIVR